MFSPKQSYTHSELLEEVRHIVEGDLVADLANISALLFSAMPDLNWLGFYLVKGNDLVVGPFQGLPACVRIPIGKGVCGRAAKDKTTIVVDDVEKFPGHISCDSRSKSEIVVPIVKDGRLVGVLDVDSPKLKRFGYAERDFFEKVASQVLTYLFP